MKNILQKTYNQIPLTMDEAHDTMIHMGNGEVSEIEMAAFISAFNMKEITIDELTGFRNALLSLCYKVKLDTSNAIDMCGTGGDGKNTFNVSTISSFVVAGAGYKVAKHGNYGVSSLCGSSNVLEHLGYEFSTDSNLLNQDLEKHNICFLHAPMFHPAMKHVAPIRKALAVKTFFNMLGPLVNPAQPKYQLVGVFNLKVARKYKYVLEKDGKQFMVVHNCDGYDEATLTAPLKILGNSTELEVLPKDFGFNQVQPSQLYGGSSIAIAAKLFTTILAGEGTQAQTEVIIANAGLAIQCFNPKQSLQECMLEAKQSIESKSAINTLKKVLA